MNISELIDLAKEKSGLTLGQMAEEIGVQQSRISALRKGDYKASAGYIAYFATKAGLPVLEMVAEIEAAQDSRFSAIWATALGNLRAATNAATNGLVTSLATTEGNWRKR